MDLKKYDRLRNKLKAKDFEGKNENLDKWLYRFSFLGNIGSIFFAFFLVYPSLYKTITIQVVGGHLGTIISYTGTIIFLIMFELIKRYLIRNFSHDLLINNNEIKASIVGWFSITIILIILSFYLSITGSKNFATTSNVLYEIEESSYEALKDSIRYKYNELRKPIINQNNEFREKVNNLPDDYISVSERYHKLISENDSKLKDIDDNEKNDIDEISTLLVKEKNRIDDSEYHNILLFIIIVIFNELIIVGGVYFREYFEHTLFKINRRKFDGIYLKRDRYKSLIMFIYNEGKLGVGDRVISVINLVELVSEKTNIPNPKKFVDEFMQDMDNIEIFNVNGKRRFIAVSYEDAITLIENFDDIYRILENME